MAKFTHNVTVYFSTCKVLFGIISRKILRFDMLTLDEIRKYVAIWESLIKKIIAKSKEVEIFFANKKVYQAFKYNKFH